MAANCGWGTANCYTFVAADTGQHTVTLTLTTAGQQTVTATDRSNTSITGVSPTLSVAETYLSASLNVASIQTGVPLSMTAQAKDSSGALVAGYVGTVQFSSTDSQFSFPANCGWGTSNCYTFTAGDAGTHSFPVTLNTAGSQTMTATDKASSSISGTSAAVTVAETYLSATLSPASAPAGVPLALTVQAKDSSGALIGDYVGTVLFTSSDAHFSIPANCGWGTSNCYTFAVADAGTHTFSATFNTGGAQTITVTDQANNTRTVTTAPESTAAISLVLTFASTQTDAGVPDTLTVQVKDGSGALVSGYAGTVQFTSSDGHVGMTMNCGWGTSDCYQFSAADGGQRAFPITFNTAGAQTVTAADQADTTANGASPVVTVAETYLSAVFGASTVQQGAPVNLTVLAKDAAGHVVTGYAGTVQGASTYDGMQLNPYTFTSADGGSHVLTPNFLFAGSMTATISDITTPGRMATTSSITVTNAPAATYIHEGTPTGLELADGSVLLAWLGFDGRLYARRNLGTATDPVWGPLVTVREPLNSGTASAIGVDSPSLVRLGSTLALFHTFSDGAYFQVWITTSTDSGATWSMPVQITHEDGHVQRLQAVTSGGTVYLFWSRQDTNGKLFYQTTTDLTSWTAKTTVGQQVGVQADNTTSNFGITRLAAGTWVLGWLAPHAGGDTYHPTVHVATSADLATWSAPVELNDAQSQPYPSSVALAQEPGSGKIYALFEQDVNRDRYVVERTSADAVTWSAQATVGYERSLPADGTQNFQAALPGLIPGSIVAVYGADLDQASGYGTSVCFNRDASRQIFLLDLLSALATPWLTSTTDDPRTLGAATCPCQQVGQPVDALTGYEASTALDMAVPALGLPLVVRRAYSSADGLGGQDGPFGVGWHWGYSVRALALKDGSVAIVEADGRRAVFWKSGGTWTAAAAINATLTAGAGGGWVLSRHDRTVWTFAASGDLVAIADRNGATQTLGYTGGQLTSISAPGGRVLSITNDANGHITKIGGPAGLSNSYTYDAGGQLISATDAAGAVTHYTYDSQHELLTVVDGDGHTVESNVYGSLGRVAQQTDAAGGVMSFAYANQTSGGSLGANRVTNARGIATDYLNDGNRRLTERDVHQGDGSSPIAQRVLWTYDQNGDITSTTDANGVVTAYTYDGTGNVLTKTVDPSGLNMRWTFTYDSGNDVLTATDPDGHATTFAYDTHGNRTSVTNALNQTTVSAYDSTGQLTSTTDANGHATTFGYSSSGDLATITTADNAVTSLAYDGAGRLTGVTDPLQHTTTFTNDGDGRLISASNALNQVTTFSYDAAGNRTKVTDALGRVASFGYDAKNRLLTTTDALGQVTTNAYDAADNLLGVTDPNGHATTYAYDALNRRISAKDTLGDTTTYGYDANGNQTRVTDALSHATTYAYDHANRLVTVTDTLGGKTSYGYDAAGNRTSVTDANSHSQIFTFDAANRVLTAADALSNTTHYGYDAAGNLVQTTLPSGAVNRQGYDSRNRLIGIDPGNTGSYSIQYAYDTANRRTSMTDPTGTTTYAYDTANRLTSITVPGTGQVQYAYDAAGERTGLTYPSGHQASYAYTARGQLQSVTDWNTKQTGYTYDNAGQLTAISFPNGVSGSLGYDTADRLASIAYVQGSTSLESIGYTRDALGNPTQMTDSTGTTAYGYDALDRLTSAAYPNKDAVSYGYDAVGNRTGLTVNGVQTTSAFDAANRLTQAGSTTYTYDANGNQLTKTSGGVTTTYGYDLLNRLTSIGGPTTASYAYNGDGLRVGKTVNGTATSYAWDPTGLGNVLGDGTGEYLWGQGLVSQVTSSATTYVQSDGLGSVRLLTDGSGNVAGRQSFDAYGASRSQSGVQLPFGYTGEQTDAESGLVYLRARYLDPSTGRFLTRDSFGGTANDPQSLNRYSYAEGNPIANTDPSGRCIGPFAIVCAELAIDAAPTLLAVGAVVVSSPVLQAALVDAFQGAQSDINTVLCPNASLADRLGAAAGLGLSALGLLVPGSEGDVASVEDLLAMMNEREGVTAEFAVDDAEQFLIRNFAEGSHLLNLDGTSSILLRRDVATRATALHEWLHVILQRRNGGYTLGEDQFIEDFLRRHSRLFRLSQ